MSKGNQHEDATQARQGALQSVTGQARRGRDLNPPSPRLRAPEPIRELLVFAPPRKYRFDLAWPDLKIACEVDGGTWISGRHNRGSSIAKDYEKLNLAVVNGRRVFVLLQIK